MHLKMMKSICTTAAIFAMTWLLSGCQARYGIKSHRVVEADLMGALQFPTVTMEVGDVIRATTPAKRPMFGGYWLGVYVEQSEVARHRPREDSFLRGTDIEAISPGRSKAYYLSAVHLLVEPVEINEWEGNNWFWIEVLPLQE